MKKLYYGINKLVLSVEDWAASPERLNYNGEDAFWISQYIWGTVKDDESLPMFFTDEFNANEACFGKTACFVWGAVFQALSCILFIIFGKETKGVDLDKIEENA